METIIGSAIFIVLVFFVYKFTGFTKIKECYSMWFNKEYWTNYNIVEASSWFAKAIIIVPGLVFGINIWQFYVLTLFTSLTLIWASNKKLLPTLVAFNTLWAWISVIVIVKNVL